MNIESKKKEPEESGFFHLCKGDTVLQTSVNTSIDTTITQENHIAFIANNSKISCKKVLNNPIKSIPPYWCILEVLYANSCRNICNISDGKIDVSTNVQSHNSPKLDDF